MNWLKDWFNSVDIGIRPRDVTSLLLTIVSDQSQKRAYEAARNMPSTVRGWALAPTKKF